MNTKYKEYEKFNFYPQNNPLYEPFQLVLPQKTLGKSVLELQRGMESRLQKFGQNQNINRFSEFNALSRIDHPKENRKQDAIVNGTNFKPAPESAENDKHPRQGNNQTESFNLKSCILIILALIILLCLAGLIYYYLFFQVSGREKPGLPSKMVISPLRKQLGENNVKTGPSTQVDFGIGNNSNKFVTQPSEISKSSSNQSQKNMVKPQKPAQGQIKNVKNESKQPQNKQKNKNNSHDAAKVSEKTSQLYKTTLEQQHANPTTTPSLYAQQDQHSNKASKF